MHLNFLNTAVMCFESGLESSLKYSIKDNHLRYSLPTCLQFEYWKNAISLMAS